MIARFPQPVGSGQADTFGRFFLQRPLGRGGATSVYVAHDPSLERDVALKILVSGSTELQERFLLEARDAARLRHPNVVTVTDVGQVNGRPYVAMDLVEGETMAEFLRRRARPPTLRRLEMAMEIVEGLAYAHRHGVVHGDFRPANVMVGVSGLVRILDFAFGRITSTAGLTNPHIPIAPFNYMSPEQITGKPLTPQSDMFSLGAVLFELFSGQQAFPGTRSTRLLQRMLAGEHEPFLSLDADLPAEAARVVERLLRPEASARFDSLTAVMLDLAVARDRLLEAEAQRAAEECDAPTLVAAPSFAEVPPAVEDEAVLAPSSEASAFFVTETDEAGAGTHANPATPATMAAPEAEVAWPMAVGANVTLVAERSEPVAVLPEPLPIELLPIAPLPIEPLPIEPLPIEPLPIEPLPHGPLSLEHRPLEPLALEPIPLPPSPLEPIPLEATDAILRRLEDLNPRQTDLTDLLLEIDRLEEVSRARRSTN